MARLSQKAGRRGLSNAVNLVKTLSLGSRVEAAEETREKPNDKVTVVQGEEEVPHAAVLELTTRYKFAKRPFDIEQRLADLWISQPPNFIEAYHQGVGYKTHNHVGLQQGKLEDIRVGSIANQLAKWETANTIAFGKLATVLGQVEEEKAQGPCTVRYGTRSQSGAFNHRSLGKLVRGFEAAVPSIGKSKVCSRRVWTCI